MLLIWLAIVGDSVSMCDIIDDINEYRMAIAWGEYKKKYQMATEHRPNDAWQDSTQHTYIWILVI